MVLSWSGVCIPQGLLEEVTFELKVEGEAARGSRGCSERAAGFALSCLLPQGLG